MDGEDGLKMNINITYLFNMGTETNREIVSVTIDRKKFKYMLPPIAGALSEIP